MGIQQEAHRSRPAFPERQLFFRQRLQNVVVHDDLPLHRPEAPLPLGLAGDERRATGAPWRAMTTSSPASVRASRRESCVLASWTLTTGMVGRSRLVGQENSQIAHAVKAGAGAPMIGFRFIATGCLHDERAGSASTRPAQDTVWRKTGESALSPRRYPVEPPRPS